MIPISKRQGITVNNNLIFDIIRIHTPPPLFPQTHQTSNLIIATGVLGDRSNESLCENSTIPLLHHPFYPAFKDCELIKLLI